MPRPVGAVVNTALSAWIASLAIDLHLVLPIAFGLLAVFLARIVFVDRENRRTHKIQTLRETLPLTFVAMLIASALIVEYDLNLPKAIFSGLGIGWVAVLLLDIIGERILALFGPSHVKLTDMAAFEETPREMRDTLHLIHRVTKDDSGEV